MKRKKVVKALTKNYPLLLIAGGMIFAMVVNVLEVYTIGGTFIGGGAFGVGVAKAFSM